MSRPTITSTCVRTAWSASQFAFFFNDTATTEIYTLSLHDALPICPRREPRVSDREPREARRPRHTKPVQRDGIPYAKLLDRKSTRLKSSHANISYAVFCLKKKKNIRTSC